MSASAAALVHSTAFSITRLDDLLAFVAANAAARPDAVYCRPGDIVWRLPLASLAGRSNVPWLRLWFDGEGMAGHGWFEAPTAVELDLRTDLAWNGAVGVAMLDWAEDVRRRASPAWPWIVDVDDMSQWAEGVRNPPKARRGRRLTASAYERDDSRVAALLERGYEYTRHHAVTFARHLREPNPAPRLPPGFRVRNVAEPTSTSAWPCIAMPRWAVSGRSLPTGRCGQPRHTPRRWTSW